MLVTPCPKCDAPIGIVSALAELTLVNTCPMCGLLHVIGGSQESIKRQLLGDEFELGRV